MLHPPFNSTLVDVPRPHIDPIFTLQEALAIVSLAARHPIAADAILLQLDRHRRGVALSRLASAGVESTHGHQRHLARGVVELCAATPGTSLAFVVSFRPAAAVAPGDAEALCHLGASLASAGFDLLDWVVVGRGGFYCPRVLIDGADPWNPARTAT